MVNTSSLSFVYRWTEMLKFDACISSRKSQINSAWTPVACLLPSGDLLLKAVQTPDAPVQALPLKYAQLDLSHFNGSKETSAL